jgi:predicted transcriptional regulator
MAEGEKRDTQFDTERVLSDCVERYRVVGALLDGPIGTAEMGEVAGVSSSTAHRIKNDLVHKGLIEERPGGLYGLTPTGEVVAREVEELREAIDRVGKLRPILESTRGRDAEFYPSMFEDAVVVTPGPESPYAPTRRFMEVFRETEQLRLVVVSTATPMFSEEKQRMIAEGKKTHAVCTESVVETTIETLPSEAGIVEDLIRNLNVHVHDDPPFSVALFDDRVGVAGHAENGKIEVFADTDDAEAYEWGEGFFERYLEEAEGMFKRFDVGDIAERLDFDPEEFLTREPSVS